MSWADTRAPPASANATPAAKSKALCMVSSVFRHRFYRGSGKASKGAV
jgi:hypothetical protein